MCLVQADMFSFAVVLWTICTEEVPIRGHLRTLRVCPKLPCPVTDQITSGCIRSPSGLTRPPIDAATGCMHPVCQRWMKGIS